MNRINNYNRSEDTANYMNSTQYPYDRLEILKQKLDSNDAPINLKGELNYIRKMLRAQGRPISLALGRELISVEQRIKKRITLFNRKKREAKKIAKLKEGNRSILNFMVRRNTKIKSRETSSTNKRSKITRIPDIRNYFQVMSSANKNTQFPIAFMNRVHNGQK